MKWSLGIRIGLAMTVLFCATRVRAQDTIIAASCNLGDIQAAVNSASKGRTVIVPPGTCEATGSVPCSATVTRHCSGVVISGKGVKIVGAGNSRVIAWSTSALTNSTGAKTLTVSGTQPTCPGGPPCAGTALTLATPNITVGQTLTIMELSFSCCETPNTMTGTVTAWNSSTGSLTVNVTSTTGTSGTIITAGVTAGSGVSIPVDSSTGFLAGSPIFVGTAGGVSEFTSIATVPDGTHLTATLVNSYKSGAPIVYGVKNQAVSNSQRWIVKTVPSTITAISSCPPHTVTVPMFSVTEDTGVNIVISNLDFMPCSTNASQQQYIVTHYASGGQPIILHDLFMMQNTLAPRNANGNATLIEGNTNRGVYYNISAVLTPFANAGPAFSNIKDTSGITNSWTTLSTWGNRDTTGTNAVYVENSDFHAFGTSTDTDDNGRLVSRYNLYNGSYISTHGADTSSWGQRYLEVYDNVFTFQGYSNGSTFNISNGAYLFLRGGSAVFHDNVMPQISSGDYGSGKDVQMIAMNLQRNQGPNPCWGTGTSGGANYPLPRQCGFGRVTGNGKTPTAVVQFNDCSFKTGCNAQGRATISSGAISSIQVDFDKGGFSSPPSCKILDSTGTGAKCTSVLMGGAVSGAVVTNQGRGYTGASSDTTTYIGDSEPIYFWNNVRSIGGGVVSAVMRTSNFCADSGTCTAGGNHCTGTVDFSANYIQLNRDYFNGLAKPGYTPYVYPHPLTQDDRGSKPASPTNLTVSVQ